MQRSLFQFGVKRPLDSTCADSDDNDERMAKRSKICSESCDTSAKICENVVKVKQVKSRKFSDVWLKTPAYSTWLEVLDGKMKCTFCSSAKKTNNFVSGSTNYQKSALDRHIASQDHKEAETASVLRIRLEKPVAASNEEFDRQLCRDKKSHEAQIRTVYMMSKKLIPAAMFNDIVDLQERTAVLTEQMKRMERVRWKKDRVTRLSTKQVITNDTELYSVRPFLKTKYDHCMMCDGFYGNNFGEPVCLTCHLFLFCNDIDKDDAGIDAPQYKEKADSDDSGNEEPDALTDFYMLPDDHPPKMQKMASSTNRQMDKLAERIACLTIPRDTDKEVVLEGLVDTLPPEVLLVVFRYLDDISLWNASNVCMRWRQIVDAETTGDQWERFIHLRWPLFKAQYKVHSWKTVYAKLLESSPCRYCIDSMMLQSTPPIEENSWRHRRLRSELKALKTDPPEGIQATPLDRHCCHWQASITGPHASPYQGGLFLLYLQIPHSYPMRPPKVRVLTKIFHPNISRHGDVSLDSIQHNWSLALTISKVLISIQSLLTDPYCHVSMEPGIGKLYCENRPEFERIARLWTWKYAMHDFILPCDISLNEV